jgi:hypothetical protein
MDAVIPIVFPDYKITVDVPPQKVDILPWFEFDNFTTPRYKDKISNLGHAGVMFINGKSGLTKYYEYGRYDKAALGIVRRVPIPDAKVSKGAIDLASLKAPLRKISLVAGHTGRIEAVYIEVQDKFDDMLKYAEDRKKQNNNPARKPYDLTNNSCIHFAKDVAKQAGVDTPWMLDPRPNSYIGEFRSDYPDLDYNYKTDVLKIEGKGVF